MEGEGEGVRSGEEREGSEEWRGEGKGVRV